MVMPLRRPLSLPATLGLAIALVGGCDTPREAATPVVHQEPAVAPSERPQVDPNQPLIIRLPPPPEPERVATSTYDVGTPSTLTAEDEPAFTEYIPWSPPLPDKSTPIEAPQRAFVREEYDEDAEAAAAATVDDLTVYFTAEGELSAHLKPDVQQAFTLARHGALHAAKGRFVELLARMARDKDAARMTGQHSRALAAGLRALDEADDFAGAGGDRSALEIARGAGHQTPMLQEATAQWTLPHEAMAMYHRYAERKLAAAVAGEEAGSMALFGIGRIYQQLATRRDPVDQPLPKALTFYRASVMAHGANHLAANEAGVLLARAGRYAQARQWLEHSARLAQLSTTHGNLAYVCQKLGEAEVAQRHAHESTRLASLEMSRGAMSAERGITWLTPEEFNRRSSGGAPSVPQASEPRIATSQQAGSPQASAPQSQQAQPSAPARQPAGRFWW